MNPALKWIGGSTAAVLIVLTAALSVNHSPKSEQVDPASWLEADDVLAESPPTAVPVVASEPSSAPQAHEAAQLVPAAATADAPLVIKRILPIKGPIRYGEWHWDDEGVPAGPLVVTVDLQARVMSVFRGGYEIGATAVMLGTDEHPTPTGTFPILSKERHNVSEKYGNAPMPWTLRLTHDGVAIHGGSEVENGYASHGCIAAPDEFVSKLFETARKGDRVIITDGVRASLGAPLAS